MLQYTKQQSNTTLQVGKACPNESYLINATVIQSFDVEFHQVGELADGGKLIWADQLNLIQGEVRHQRTQQSQGRGA
jgi:hypothetical protein